MATGVQILMSQLCAVSLSLSSPSIAGHALAEKGTCKYHAIQYQYYHVLSIHYYQTCSSNFVCWASIAGIPWYSEGVSMRFTVSLARSFQGHSELNACSPQVPPDGGRDAAAHGGVNFGAGSLLCHHVHYVHLLFSPLITYIIIYIYNYVAGTFGVYFVRSVKTKICTVLRIRLIHFL